MVSGIHSVSFQDNILTLGTGVGEIMFYDLRAGKYLEIVNTAKAVTLKTSHSFAVSNIFNLHAVF